MPVTASDFEGQLDFARRLGSRWDEVRAYLGLGLLELERGALPDALDQLTQASRVARTSGLGYALACCHMWKAITLDIAGDDEEAGTRIRPGDGGRTFPRGAPPRGGHETSLRFGPWEKGACLRGTRRTKKGKRAARPSRRPRRAGAVSTADSPPRHSGGRETSGGRVRRNARARSSGACGAVFGNSVLLLQTRPPGGRACYTAPSSSVGFATISGASSRYTQPFGYGETEAPFRSANDPRYRSGEGR